MKLLTQRNKVASDKLSILVLFKTFLYQNTEKHFTHINEKHFLSIKWHKNDTKKDVIGNLVNTDKYSRTLFLN